VTDAGKRHEQVQALIFGGVCQTMDERMDGALVANLRGKYEQLRKTPFSSQQPGDRLGRASIRQVDKPP
jgi:hypothetical protein